MTEVDEEDFEGPEDNKDLVLCECREECDEVIIESANLEGASAEKEAQGNETRESL